MAGDERTVKRQIGVSSYEAKETASKLAQYEAKEAASKLAQAEAASACLRPQGGIRVYRWL
ncbi:hypothetical protein [Paenibacillus oenotherae]|uniref:hypothetical protein n=1 Tax=Paenibacillus oenotherae TaxID=1435645 RepID=UPI001FE92606|nr:hypothetical protein [Paenibacillus oenotherae]